MTAKRKRKFYERRMWGGFVDGRLHLRMIDTGWGGWGNGATSGMPAIYPSRQKARKHYEDVRPILVREIFR